MLRCLAFVWIASLAVPGLNVAAEERVSVGLVVLSDFEEGEGTTIRDRSNALPSLDLRIEMPRVVRWKPGAVVIDGSAMIASAAQTKKVVDAVTKSGALSIEVWIKPGNVTQEGPARIVSLSADPGHRNFTLGQGGSKYEVRLRTEKSAENGVPSLATPENVLTTALTHVVHRRDSAGLATTYVNGQPQAIGEIVGSLASWSGDFRLLLANELTSDRPWRGELHLVAVYDRALTADEVAQNLKAGASWSAFDVAARLPPAANRQVDFVKYVQPLLRKHCFECHSVGEVIRPILA